MRVKKRFRRTRSGDFDVRLSDEERTLLRNLIPQLRELIQRGEGDEPSLRRLRPSAYPDDPDADAEYRSLVYSDLDARRLAGLDTLEATAAETRLSAEQLLIWMGTINDLRLVLGTNLDVSEESDLMPAGPADDPESQALVVYSYLGWLLEQIVAEVNP